MYLGIIPPVFCFLYFYILFKERVLNWACLLTWLTHNHCFAELFFIKLSPLCDYGELCVFIAVKAGRSPLDQVGSLEGFQVRKPSMSPCQRGCSKEPLRVDLPSPSTRRNQHSPRDDALQAPVKSLFHCVCGPLGVKGYLQLVVAFTFPLWTKAACLLERVRLVYALFVPVSQRELDVVPHVWTARLCVLVGTRVRLIFSQAFPAILIASLKQTNSYILYKTTEHTIQSGFSDALYNDWPKAYPNIMYYGSSSEFFEEER